jgi:hypothetical protein
MIPTLVEAIALASSSLIEEVVFVKVMHAFTFVRAFNCFSKNYDFDFCFDHLYVWPRPRERGRESGWR